MRVVLLAEVKGLGARGAVVDVAPGYARNYLLPRRLAAEANEGMIRQFREADAAREHKSEQQLLAAQGKAARLHGAAVEIKMRVGAGGRLFGAVTSREIAEAVAAAYGISIDRRKVELPEPLKEVGTYRVSLKLHPQVAAEVEVRVVPE